MGHKSKKRGRNRENMKYSSTCKSESSKAKCSNVQKEIIGASTVDTKTSVQEIVPTEENMISEKVTKLENSNETVEATEDTDHKSTVVTQHITECKESPQASSSQDWDADSIETDKNEKFESRKKEIETDKSAFSEKEEASYSPSTHDNYGRDNYKHNDYQTPQNSRTYSYRREHDRQKDRYENDIHKSREYRDNKGTDKYGPRNKRTEIDEMSFSGKEKGASYSQRTQNSSFEYRNYKHNYQTSQNSRIEHDPSRSDKSHGPRRENSYYSETDEPNKHGARKKHIETDNFPFSEKQKVYGDNGKQSQRRSCINSFLKFIEIGGDLFEAPSNVSLAHCVAEDLKMGSGIAVTFRQNFKRLDELYDQKKKVGQVAVLEDNGRYIYYLITKKLSNGKPTMDDLCKSLSKMKEHCISHDVKSLAMPRIGCGLDRLEWKVVSFELQNIFSDLPMEITIYNFNQNTSIESAYTSKKPVLSIKQRIQHLVSIPSQTALIFFGSTSGEINPTIESLNKKYNFLYDYKQAAKNLGDVLPIWKRNELICGLIVKNKESDELSYKILVECFRGLFKILQSNQYYYVGIEAFEDHGDDLTTEKIVNLLRLIYCHRELEIWVCWPPYLAEASPSFYKPQSVYNNFLMK